MGHSTATVTVSAEAAERIRSEAANRKTSTPRGWGYLYTGYSFEAAMVREAVSIWRDDEASRWDDARAGDGHLTKIMSDDQAAWFEHHNQSLVVNESTVIPIADPEDVVVRQRNETIEVPGALIARLRQGFYEGHDELRALLRKTHGDSLVGIEVVKLPASRKPQATATEGKAKTVYEIHDPNRFRTRPVLATVDTQAEARAEAIRLMTENERLDNLKVVAKVVREGGEDALVVITRPEPATGKVTVKVTTHAVKADAKPAHYRVSFDYHH